MVMVIAPTKMVTAVDPPAAEVLGVLLNEIYKNIDLWPAFLNSF
jgi:hypothetical protein